MTSLCACLIWEGGTRPFLRAMHVVKERLLFSFVVKNRSEENPWNRSPPLRVRSWFLDYATGMQITGENGPLLGDLSPPVSSPLARFDSMEIIPSREIQTLARELSAARTPHFVGVGMVSVPQVTCCNRNAPQQRC